MMNNCKPCGHEKTKEGCHLCWLFDTRDDYKKLWTEGCDGKPIVTVKNDVRKHLCIHLGKRLERNQKCFGKCKHECLAGKEFAIPSVTCGSCELYEPDN